MKLTVREAIKKPNGVTQKNEYVPGEIIGIVEAGTVYAGAVTASREVFKNGNTPQRRTGWAPHEGGLFFTMQLEGEARVRDKPFFLEVVR